MQTITTIITAWVSFIFCIFVWFFNECLTCRCKARADLYGSSRVNSQTESAFQSITFTWHALLSNLHATSLILFSLRCLPLRAARVPALPTGPVLGRSLFELWGNLGEEKKSGQRAHCYVREHRRYVDWSYCFLLSIFVCSGCWYRVYELQDLSYNNVYSLRHTFLLLFPLLY